MHIVHLAAEFAPIAKAGGLAEAVTGLAFEQARSGNSVDVIIPKYDFIPGNFKADLADFMCLGVSNTMWTHNIERCRLNLLESSDPAGYFRRGVIYGCGDDIARFLYFSRAALEYLLLKNEPIDVLHLHDWHVSICAPLVKRVLTKLKVKAVVLSLHNVEYQGKCASQDLNAIGLSGEEFLSKEKLQDDNPLYPGTINLLKGAIVYSDAIVAVSPSYAKEILTPAYSFGLSNTFIKAQHKIKGILNGIDPTLWNPDTDSALAARYTLSSVEAGKKDNRSSFALDQTKRPWIGAVSRLASQKGPELFEEALYKTLELGGCFLLLGSATDPLIQEKFNLLKEKFRDHPQVFLQYEYNEALARRIYAALDLVLVPSHFEPCGLTQMIAMHYGTVPIVRKTGGLKDTVFDCEDPNIPVDRRNGFCFADATKASMNHSLERAVSVFRSEPHLHQSLMRRGMQTDFSWKKPAREYEKLYAQCVYTP